ncbi:MAG: hypothetical protein KF729_05305 [Sandaracinaceae bacterium]|nr:hypothetical protein [Sandaracinaceae bacterium]
MSARARRRRAAVALVALGWLYAIVLGCGGVPSRLVESAPAAVEEPQAATATTAPRPPRVGFDERGAAHVVRPEADPRSLDASRAVVIE